MPASSISPPLPPEIWLDIFSFAVHEPGVLDTKWDYSPDQLIWQGVWASKQMEQESLRLRETIVRVSREWRDLGRRFLYEDLVVDSTVKVKALVTLFEQSVSAESGGADADTTSLGYGRWVKRFFINSGSLFEESSDLERLLRQCPNVLAIFWNNAVVENLYQPTISRLLWPPRSLRRISFEGLGAGFKGSRDIFPLTHPPLHLDWVALPSNWMIEIFSSVGGSSAPISLSNISVLEIDIHQFFARLPAWDLPAWDLPALRYLCIDSLYNARIPSLLPFIAKNGRRLLGLSLRTSDRCSNLVQLLKHTPSLRSLVFDDFDLGAICEPNSPTCPNITHIGIVNVCYHSLANTRRVGVGLDYILQYNNLFPGLLTVRILTNKVPPRLIKEWNDPITTASQYGIRLEDYQRRLLSVQQVEEEPEG